MSDRPPPPEGARPTAGASGAQARSGGPARPGGSDPDQQRLLGLLLVGLAIVIGVVLLARGFSDENGLVAPAPEPAATEPDEESRDAPPTTEPSEGATTTTAPPGDAPDPGEVVVLVANAGGPSGAAGETSDRLADDGFEMLVATNATDQVESTEIQFGEGQEQGAQLVADALGVSSDAVGPLADPPPVADLTGAQVLVLVGPDTSEGGGESQEPEAEADGAAVPGVPQ